LIRDDAFAGQMALRDELVADRRAEVTQSLISAGPATTELLALVMAAVSSDPDYRIEGDTVMRPDGRIVRLLADTPLVTAARLVQEDFLILQRRSGPYVLTAAFAAFPASWTLAEKFGVPLADIHGPVQRYDADLAARVDRIL